MHIASSLVRLSHGTAEVEGLFSLVNLTRPGSKALSAQKRLTVEVPPSESSEPTTDHLRHYGRSTRVKPVNNFEKFSWIYDSFMIRD